MIKKVIKRIKSKLGEKKGATMIVVITTMTLLMIIGSGFATLAFQSYRHSYGSICRQQAMFTAKGVLDGFIDEFKINQTLRENVIKKLEETIATNPEADVTKIDAEINIKNLHDYMADSGAFGTAGEEEGEGNNTKDCMMYVSYSDLTRTKLKLTVAAKYKGFYNSLSVILGYTNNASYELSKIMGNALYFMTPVINLAIEQIQGDVYIDKNEYGDHNANGVDDFFESVEALRAFTTANEIMKGGRTINMDLFGNTYKYSDGTEVDKGHEWVEVYIRTWKTIATKWQDVPEAIVGNLKCNSSVLLGLADRSSSGRAHGFEHATGYDSVSGQNLNHTCLRVSEDIYVNGNVRGENFICKNLFAVDNDNDSEFTGNIVAECQGGRGPGGVGFNSHIVILNDIRADGFVVIHGGTSGLVGGDIYAGRYNQDGSLWGKPGIGDITNDNGNYVHGTGDVEITYTDVNGNIYAEGDVIIKDASTVKGNVYAKGDVYIKNSNVNGNIYCGGDLTILEERNGRRHVVGGTTNVGGNLSMKGNYANADTFVHLDGDISVKGNISMYDRAVLGGANKAVKVYCGGNLHMDGESSLDDMNGYTYVKGNFYSANSWVKTKIYVCGNTTFGDGTWIYRNIYSIGIIETRGKVLAINGKPLSQSGGHPDVYSNTPSSISIGKANQYGHFTWGADYITSPKQLSNLTDIFRNGKFTVETVENNPFFANIDTYISEEIGKANKAEEDINKKLTLYSNTVNAIVKNWSSPKPVTSQEGGDYVQGGAVYPKVGGAISATDNTYRSPNNPNEFIIDCNVLNLQKIELSTNQVLTIDTSKKNIHIVLTGDMRVGPNATIKVKGSNMAFIYLEAPKGVKQYVTLEEGARIGLVEEVAGGSTKNAGLHIVSSKKGDECVDFTVGKRLDIRSFNYIPYGYLNIAGGKNTVYAGSFVIGYIDIGGWSDSVFDSSYVKFNGEKSPLILDITNDMQYGDSIGEIEDFGQIQWDIIDYV